MTFFIRIGRFYCYKLDKFRMFIEKDTSKLAHKTRCAIIERRDANDSENQVLEHVPQPSRKD